MRPPRPSDELFLVDRLLNTHVSGLLAMLRGDEDAVAQVAEVLRPYQNLMVTAMWFTGANALRSGRPTAERGRAQRDRLVHDRRRLVPSIRQRTTAAVEGGRRRRHAVEDVRSAGAGTVALPLLEMVGAMHADDVATAKTLLPRCSSPKRHTDGQKATTTSSRWPRSWRCDAATTNVPLHWSMRPGGWARRHSSFRYADQRHWLAPLAPLRWNRSMALPTTRPPRRVRSPSCATSTPGPARPPSGPGWRQPRR